MRLFAERPFLSSFLLLFLGLGVRAVYLWQFQSNPLFDYVPTQADHYNFDRAAISFTEGDWLVNAPNNSYAPLYKYFLGILYWIFGRDFFWVYGVQFLMGALAGVILFWIGRECFGVLAGLGAYFLWTFFTTEIIYEGIILRAAFIAFWGIVAFYFLVRLKSRPGKGLLIVSALSVSLFIQGRPNTILCLPIVYWYLHQYIIPVFQKESRRRFWWIFNGVLFGSFIPLLIQCYLVHGKFVFFDASGPHTFMSGNLIQYSGVGFEHELVEGFRKDDRLGYLSNIKYLVQHIWEFPWEFIKLYFRKVYFFLNDFEAPTNISVYIYREYSGVLKGLINHFSFISAFGLAGMLIAFRKKQEAFLLYGFTISLTISVVLFLNESRYRIPVVPWFALWGGYAISQIIQTLKAGKTKSFAGTLGVVALLIYCFAEPQGMVRVRANDYGTLGAAFLERGNSVKALESLQKAVVIQPENPHTHLNLGTLHAQKGQWKEAGNEYLLAVKLAPDLWEAQFNLGMLYSKVGNHAEAKQAFQKALKENPKDPKLWNLLAMAEARLNRPQEAIRLLEKSRALDPNHSQTYFLLGIQYRQMNQLSRAKIFLKKAISLNPRSAQAYNNLGVTYQKLNQLEEARQAYEQAVALKPDFEPYSKNLEAVNSVLSSSRAP